MPYDPPPDLPDLLASGDLPFPEVVLDPPATEVDHQEAPRPDSHEALPLPPDLPTPLFSMADPLEPSEASSRPLEPLDLPSPGMADPWALEAPQEAPEPSFPDLPDPVLPGGQAYLDLTGETGTAPEAPGGLPEPSGAPPPTFTLPDPSEGLKGASGGREWGPEVLKVLGDLKEAFEKKPTAVQTSPQTVKWEWKAPGVPEEEYAAASPSIFLTSNSGRGGAGGWGFGSKKISTPSELLEPFRKTF